MGDFIKRPILYLLRYELPLRGIPEETAAGQDDLETIAAVLDVIKGLGNELEPDVVSAKQKVELWGYNATRLSELGRTSYVSFPQPVATPRVQP